MAVPKKKVSRSRRNMRRFAGGNRLDKPTVQLCDECGEMIRPHRLCGACGHYRGKSVMPGKTVAHVEATPAVSQPSSAEA